MIPRIPFILGVLTGLAIGIMLCRGKQMRKQATENAFEQKMNERNAQLRKDIDTYKYDRKEKRLSRWQQMTTIINRP